MDDIITFWLAISGIIKVKTTTFSHWLYLLDLYSKSIVYCTLSDFGFIGNYVILIDPVLPG